MRKLLVAWCVLLVALAAPAGAIDVPVPPPTDVPVPPVVEIPVLPPTDAPVPPVVDVPVPPPTDAPVLPVLPGVDGAVAPEIAGTVPAVDIPVPPTIDPTGQQDVTRPLNEFLASVCSSGGGTVQFPPGARYRVEGTLELVGCHGLTVEGNGAEIVATTPGARTRSHWRVRGGSNLIFRNIVVRGANPRAGTGNNAYRPAREAQHGFEALAVRGLLLEGVTVTDVYGDFVYLGGERQTQPDGSVRLVWSQDVTVRGSTLQRNGRQGITITAAERVLIEGNQIGETRRSTFDIEPNNRNGGARDVRIVGNSIGAGRLLFLAMGGVGGQIDNVQVVGNYLLRSLTATVNASDGGRRSNLVIADNVGHGPHISSSAALRFWDVDGLVVTGNEAMFRPRRNTTAVQVRRSCGFTVEDNVFHNAGRDLDSRPWSC